MNKTRHLRTNEKAKHEIKVTEIDKKKKQRRDDSADTGTVLVLVMDSGLRSAASTQEQRQQNMQIMRRSGKRVGSLYLVRDIRVR